MRTSPSYTASYRIEVDEKTTSIASIVDAVSSTGAEIKGLDVADSDRGRIIIDLTCDMRDSEHRREVRDARRDRRFGLRPDLHEPHRRQGGDPLQGAAA